MAIAEYLCCTNGDVTSALFVLLARVSRSLCPFVISRLPHLMNAKSNDNKARFPGPSSSTCASQARKCLASSCSFSLSLDSVSYGSAAWWGEMYCSWTHNATMRWLQRDKAPLLALLWRSWLRRVSWWMEAVQYGREKVPGCFV